MITRRRLAVILISIIALSPILRAQDDSEGSLAKEVKQFAAAVTEELKANRELLKKMSADMDTLQGRIEQLQREVTKLSLENARLEKLLDQQGKKLSKELVNERKTRALNDKKIVDELTAAMAGNGKKPAATTNNDNRRHHVRPGDTLIVIAKAYNSTVSGIKEANELKSDKIMPGQVLIIP